MRLRFLPAGTAFLTALLLPSLALAEEAKIDPADTAWMTVATALVLMMTLPGLALFYAGMVRKKNLLATMAQSVASVALISLLWIAAGYTLAFSGDGPWLGNLERVFLAGLTPEAISPLAKTIPEALFMLYQMTFAVITCALIGGGVADRMKFSSFLLFTALWLFVVYVPSAHWVWGGGFLGAAGVLDFAGGTVVHINAGIAGLIATLVVGNRKGWGHDNMAPYDLSMAIVGTGLLWVGWMGFNGGSALGIGTRSTFAILSTHLAACAGALMWTAIEWFLRGKPSVLGIISGAIAGLGTVTPASGYILPWHGIVIGLIAGAVCFWTCSVLKQRFKYDDSLDVFGVHGVGGLIGTMLAGVFATASVSAAPGVPGLAGLIDGNAAQITTQAYGTLVTTLWCAAGTWVCLMITKALVGLRVEGEDERIGLDIVLHGESVH